MIQDYFSLDKKGNDYLLLRIINKVDFEEEVVWARDFSLSDRTGISKPVEQLIEEKPFRYISFVSSPSGSRKSGC